jgi:hypothetical protein
MESYFATFSRTDAECVRKLNTASKENFAFESKQGVIFYMFVCTCNFFKYLNKSDFRHSKMQCCNKMKTQNIYSFDFSCENFTSLYHVRYVYSDCF